MKPAPYHGLLRMASACAWLLGSSADAQLVSAEWFLDDDPGAGSGTPITAVDGSFGAFARSVATQAVDVASLSSGTHRFGLRFLDLTHGWGPVQFADFDVREPAALTPEATPPTRRGAEIELCAEGYAPVTAALADGAGDEAVETLAAQTLAAAGWTAGVQRVALRLRASDGAWSEPQPLDVEVRGAEQLAVDPPLLGPGGEGLAPRRVAEIELCAEGYAPVTAALADGAGDEAVETLAAQTLAAAGWTAGVQRVALRLRASDGAWSEPQPLDVEVRGAEQLAVDPPLLGPGGEELAPRRVAELELCAEGYAPVTAAFADGAGDEAVETLAAQTLAAAGWTAGVQRVALRLRASDGAWSEPQSLAVEVRGVAQLAVDPPLPGGFVVLQGGECFVGTDPGEGSGVLLGATDFTWDSVEETVVAAHQAAGLRAGPQRMGVRYRDSMGRWSAPIFDWFEFESSDPEAPFFGLQPEGRDSVLHGDVLLVATVNGSEPMTLQWWRGSTPLADATNVWLALPRLGFEDVGGYQLVASNAYGVATSAVARVELLSTSGVSCSACTYREGGLRIDIATDPGSAYFLLASYSLVQPEWFLLDTFEGTGHTMSRTFRFDPQLVPQVFLRFVHSPRPASPSSPDVGLVNP